MGDCTIGKELKQSTCRYVKKCKPGWIRNDKYICRKTLRRTGKHVNNSPIIVTTDKQKQFKNIFGTPSPSPNGMPKLTKNAKTLL